MDKVETKKHEPVVYRVYDYLKKNHLGKENGITRNFLCMDLGINKRKLREITSEINSSKELDKLVSTTHCCYICNTKEECEKSIRNTYRTAISMILKAKNMERKVSLNNQIKMKLGKYYKDVIETFSDEEE